MVGESEPDGSPEKVREEIRERFGELSPSQQAAEARLTNVFVPLCIAPSVVQAAFAVVAARRLVSANKDVSGLKWAAFEFSLAMLRRECSVCRSAGSYALVEGHTCNSIVDNFLSGNLKKICLIFDIPFTPEITSEMHAFLVRSTDLSAFF